MTVRYTEWTQEKLDAVLDESITAIGLTVRTANRLEEKGLLTIRDLLHCTKPDLMGIPNFGEKTYEEVMLGLRRMGFY
jgi:DNA-directed RNA polymerase subunit alpha